MDPLQIIQIVIIVLLIIGSAFFSASETAYTSSSKIRLKTLADDGNKKAEKVLAFLEKYDRFISTVLIGNNIVNIMSASLATVFFVALVGQDLGPTLSTIVMTLVVLTFGEVLPKSLAKNFPERMAMIFYPVLKTLSYIFFPLCIVFESLQKLMLKLFKKKGDDDIITEDELLTIIDEIEEEGKIKPYEKELISSAIKFDDIEVKEIVTPRKSIIAVEESFTVEEIHKIFKESKYTRLPVYKDTIDNVIGILNEKDFYQIMMDNEINNEDFNIREVMTPVHFFYDEQKISIVFKRFKEERYHMAIVLDQYDGTLGLITLEDVLEELVGEIFDETDEIFDETVETQEGQFVVSGKEMLYDAFEIIEIEIEEDLENQTVNAWVCQQLGRIPSSGDNFLYKDEWKITVLSASKKGANSVRFERLD